jgi:hypothetical protein
MPDPIYFQWQNKFLLKTIYPLRPTKLRDFLVFFYEVEVWEQYKDKTPADISGDIQEFCEAQKKKVNDSFDTYDQLKAYFLNDDIAGVYSALFPQVDTDVLARFTVMHRAFKTYFPKYTNPAQIKYFISQRVRECEDLGKNVLFQISENKRFIRNMGPTWVKKPDCEQKIQLLSSVSGKMVDEELHRLNQFLGAYEQLSKYQQDLDQRKAQREKAKLDAAASLKATRAQMDPLVAQLDALRVATGRLVNPPGYPALRDYFLKPDASADYQDFSNPDPAILVRIQALHKDFNAYYPGYKTPGQEKSFIGMCIQNFESLRDQKQKDLTDKQRAASWLDPATPGGASNDTALQALKKITLPMLMRELNKLYDLQWSHDRLGQPNQNFSAQIAQNQAAMAGLQSQLDALRKTEADTLVSISQLDQQMNVPVQDQVQALVAPQFVIVKDVVRWKTETYKQEIQDVIEQYKDQIEISSAMLLERVVQEFTNRPERYPLWLQYMVIHFSGMRYQSAHGSWADPKDLLSSLRSLFVQKAVAPLKEDSVNALCEEKFFCYQAARSGNMVLSDGSETEHDIPALALTKEPNWVEKVDYHLKSLDPNGGYYKRRALMDTRIDEEDYDVEHYTDQQALDALEDLKTELPDWMWREIVRVTDLRLTEVTDENWEQVSDDDMLERYAKSMGMYRDILNDWKRANLTAWREEHDQTDKLIVTRAVCNEVAEHIQHIRGNTPPGGLTAKPEWYLRLEKNSRTLPTEKRSFFVKPKTIDDFKAGASLFWLRWMNKEPNPWQITRPLVMGSGEELVPQGGDGINTIRNAGNAYQRTVYQKDSAGFQGTQVQWLRWMHEATIVKVTETVDGPTVLTFETATPIDDRRQATIGVFKRMASDLYNRITPSIMSGAFVGYTPESDVPYDHLHEMLDWNHILLREALSADQIQQYWQKMEKLGEISYAIPEWREEIQVEVAPLLAPGRWITVSCYELALDGQSMSVYQPPVVLKRGLRLTVNKTGRIECAGQAYYPVTRCDAEPRAQDLYIPCDEVIEAPEDSTLPVKVREDLELYRISGIDLRGRPVFEPAGAHLVTGTRLRVSTIQHIGPDAPGGGLVVGQGRRRYYLIQSCPRVHSVEGLFVMASQVKKIAEKEYALSYLQLATK